MVPPFPLRGWRRPRRESALRSHLALWRHVKNEDSYTFWKDFGFARGDSRGLFWVCFWHGLQGCPQTSPKGTKRYPKVSPKVPKGHPKAPKTNPKITKIQKGVQKVPKCPPKGNKRSPKGSKNLSKGHKDPPKGVQKVRGESLRWKKAPPQHRLRSAFGTIFLI